MWTMSSGDEENDEGIEPGLIDETDPVFRSVAEADVSLDEMMSLACRQGKLDIVELLLESGAHVDYRNKAGNTPLLEACSQGHVDVARYLLDHNANIDAPTETTSDSALTWACTLGNEAIVELLLERTSDVEHRTKDGCTALMFAALAGHVKVAAMLLDHGAKINVESDSNKDSPLTFACWKGHCDVVELLLERNANIEHRTKEGFTPLMFAALGGHTDVARKLLERKAKVNVPSGSNNDIPLTSACWKGHHDVVKLLLEFNSNIEHRTKDGCTPLMLAAREGHYSVAKLILDSNAEVNVPSGSENNIPLTLACWKGHTNVVELLLEHKSNIEHRNKAGCTPLMLASREGHVETTSLLLNKGAEINTPSGSNDDTPLTLACWKGHVDVVNLLLKHNSKVDHQTKTGCTPLMEATREGHVAVAEQLLAHGADVELPDNYGQSPLFMACWKGHRDVAELLLENVANRDCRTKTGITPLFQACRENHVDVVELLLDYGASVNAPFPNSRENPLTLAGEKGHVELVSLLLSRNANVECHTKKGCTPFHLACKEGHLEIGVQLLEKGADTEATDSRNNTPLVASMKNGHVEVVEWLLNVVNHLPSEDQCQKCLVAPVDDKEKHDDMMLGRTKCYDLVTKAKKAREQKVQRNTEIFLRELEHEKEKEDIRKKKAAAKRRDKRKRKKAAKDSETLCGVQVGEDLPLENRPQEMADDFDHDQEDNVGDVVDTTREPCSEELLTENNHQEMKTNEKEYLLAQDALKNRQIADDDRNKLKICPSNKRSTLDSGHAKPKRPLSSTGDVSTPQNSLCPHQKGRARSQSAGKETESKNNTLPDKNSRKKSDEPAKITKKKIILSNSDKADSVKTQKIELKTKTTSEVTQSVTVNCVKPDVKQQTKAEKPSSKKESSEKANSSANSPKKNSYSKQQNVGNTSSVGDKSSSSKDSSVSGTVTTKKSSDATQTFIRRGKDTTNAVDNNTPTTSTVTDSRTSTKGTLAAGHSSSGSNKTTPTEGEREHKPIHSPRSKQQHSQLGRGEDNWKEVTRSTNSKTVMYQLTAPNAICGRVIGRGGSKINSITEESGAQITIGKPEPKNPTDRVITIKGSNKAVQRAKFLVTQALNTPSTIGQTTSSVSTATTSNAMSSSDRTQTSTSPAPVRGNYAAIPSSSSSSEWPTIEQANNMAVQAPAAKPTAPNRNDKPSEGTKSSPELSDGSQEVFEDAVVASADVVVSGTETSSIFATSTPVVADSTQTTSSAWKPYRQSSPQSMGACTSAVTTSGSSSMTVANSQEPIGRLMIEKHNGDVPAPHRPFHLQGTSCVQAQAQPRNNRLSDMQGLDPITLHESWEQKVSSSSTSTSVATVSISTSAVTTANHRDHHITPENPFGVIGEVSVATSAYQTEAAVPDFNSQQESLLQNRVSSSSGDATTSGLLQSPRERNKSKLPSYFSSWASQPSGFSDISSDSITSGRKLEGPLPGMNIFTSSLFSTGSLSSYPWSTGEDSREHEERARSISWSGQHDYQGEQFISPVKEKFSPSSQKSGSDAAAVNLRASDLRGDSGTFKSLSSGIWGPVSSQPPHAASLSVVCDDSTPDKQAWNNSDSTSSSRSSSRQELSSIMDSDLPPSNNVWNSSALLEDMTPTPQERNSKNNTPLGASMKNGHVEASQGDQSGNNPKLREFTSYLKEGSKAMTEKKNNIAVCNYGEAVTLLKENGNQYQIYEMKEIDFVILLYSFGAALLEVGGQEELLTAKKHFEIIVVEHKTVVFPLAYLGTGRVFYKQNRFTEALDHLEEGLGLVNKLGDEKLASYRWPGSQVIIDDTKPGKLLSAIQTLIRICRHPPRPDVICRYPDCPNKTQIYLTDPDYKGYIRLICHENCKVDFHPGCWKKQKSSEDGKTGDKDFLDDICMTPDCEGSVINVQIYDMEGLKTEFKHEKPATKQESKPKQSKQNKLKANVAGAKQKKKKDKDDIKIEDFATPETSPSDIGEEKMVHNPPPPPPLPGQKEGKPMKGDHNQLEKSGQDSSDASIATGDGVFILKKEEDEDSVKGVGVKGVNKVKTKKKKLKNTQTLDEFLKDHGGVQTLRPPYGEDYEDLSETPRPTCKFDVVTQPPGWSQQEVEAPFAIPPHLQDSAAELEASYKMEVASDIISTSLPPPPSISLEAVTEYVSSMLHKILRVQGGLELADPSIMQPLSMLPDDYQDIISSAGGLRAILEQSGKFLFDGNRVMLPEDKEFEDLVKTLKPASSNNPFLDRTNSGFKTNIKQEKGTQDNNKSNSVDVLFTTAGKAHDGGVDSSSSMSSSPVLNPNGTEYVSSSQTDLLSASSSKTSIGSDSTLKGDDDEQTIDRNDTLVENPEQNNSNGETLVDSVSEGDLTVTKSTNETQGENYQDFASDTTSLKAEHLSLNDNNVADSSYDDSRVNTSVETVEKEVSLLVASEDNNPSQSNKKLNAGVSTTEPAIVSKTKAVQTQPNVKSKGVGTDPIPEPFKAEYQRVAAEKDALQARLQENVDRHNALLNKNSAEVEKVKKKLADALQEKEKYSKDVQEVKKENQEEIRKLRQQCEDKDDKIKTLNHKLVQEAQDKTNVITSVKKELSTVKGQYTSEKDSWNKERSEKDELLKNTKAQNLQQQARAQDAEIKLLELRRDVGLRFLERAFQESHITINNLIQAVNARITGPKVEEVVTAWKNYASECHQRVVQCKTTFNEQIDLLKNGRTLSSLPQLNIPGPPPYPGIPVLQSLVPGQQQNQTQAQPQAQLQAQPQAQPQVQAQPQPQAQPQLQPQVQPQLQPQPPLQPQLPLQQHLQPQLQPQYQPSPESNILTPEPPVPTSSASANTGGPLAAAPLPVIAAVPVGAEQPLVAGNLAVGGAMAVVQDKARPSNSFEKIMLRLSTMYPNFTRLELTGFIKEVRSNKHGSLTGLSLEDIVASVSELVEQKKKAGLLRTTPVAHAKQPQAQKTQQIQISKLALTEAAKMAIATGSYEEDPCVICHEDMNASIDIVTLECGHRYHSPCIRKWLLGEQSTCPTCRVHALLPDEFPRLR